jgi:LacI family transcriptional regulator
VKWARMAVFEFGAAQSQFSVPIEAISPWVGSAELSSVRHDLEGRAYEAAALLDRLMNGERPPEIPKRITPKGVVTRKSTEILAVEDSDVVAAISYIQENFRKGNLSVDDVVSLGRVPRRSLERAFRSELQRTTLHRDLAP